LNPEQKIDDRGKAEAGASAFRLLVKYEAGGIVFLKELRNLFVGRILGV
jgi:hypothetical protein